MDVVCVPVDPL